MKSISSVLLLALVACSSSSNSNVALNARAGTAASTAAAPLGQQAQALQACGAVITRVRMVISEVKLEADQTTSDAGSSSGEVEFKSAPSLLDLPQSALDSGTTQQVIAAEVPAGTYHEIRFKIHKISTSEAGSNAGLQDMANNSVKVDYTKTGTTQSATFVTDVDAQQKMEGTFPLTEGSHALTLNVDASTWFNNPKGGCLDPANPNDASDIDNNIQKSLKAYKDDDHDGHEDH